MPCSFGKSIPLMVKLVMLLAAVLNTSGCISNTEECEKGSLWGAERQTRHKPDYERAEGAETPCPWWSLAAADVPKSCNLTIHFKEKNTRTGATQLNLTSERLLPLLINRTDFSLNTNGKLPQTSRRRRRRDLLLPSRGSGTGGRMRRLLSDALRVWGRQGSPTPIWVDAERRAVLATWQRG